MTHPDLRVVTARSETLEAMRRAGFPLVDRHERAAAEAARVAREIESRRAS